MIRPSNDYHEARRNLRKKLPLTPKLHIKIQVESRRKNVENKKILTIAQKFAIKGRLRLNLKNIS